MKLYAIALCGIVSILYSLRSELTFQNLAPYYSLAQITARNGRNGGTACRSRLYGNIGSHTGALFGQYRGLGLPDFLAGSRSGPGHAERACFPQHGLMRSLRGMALRHGDGRRGRMTLRRAAGPVGGFLHSLLFLARFLEQENYNTQYDGNYDRNRTRFHAFFVILHKNSQSCAKAQIFYGQQRQ